MFKPRTFESITAPLSKIAAELTAFVDFHSKTIDSNTAEIARLNEDSETRAGHIKKARATIANVQKLIS